MLVFFYFVFLIGIFATTFSRHAKAQASLALVVWLIENVVSSRAGEGLPWCTVGSADKDRSV